MRQLGRERRGLGWPRLLGYLRHWLLEGAIEALGPGRAGHRVMRLTRRRLVQRDGTFKRAFGWRLVGG